MHVLTTVEMRAAERAADAAGNSYAAMMERAGRAVADVVSSRGVSPGGRNGAGLRVLVLVGPGNNGGDGLVAATALQGRGHACTAYLWKRNAATEPLSLRASQSGVQMVRAEEDANGSRLKALVQTSDVIVDALLGTGATGPLRGSVRDVLLQVGRELAIRRARPIPSITPVVASSTAPFTALGPLVVAVDGPSGLDFDTGAIDDAALPADLTVTFGCPKLGHFALPGAARTGELLVADIGLDATLLAGVCTTVATAESVHALLPARPADAHKGTFGKALVVAGSSNYVGAASLAASGAYRVGAGLVTLAIAERIQPIVAAQLSEATYLLLPNDLGAITDGALQVLEDKIGSFDALLVGPGLGSEQATAAFVRQLVGADRSPSRRSVGFVARGEPSGATALAGLPALALDADALNLLAGRSEWWQHLPVETVITPHPGEMSRLTGLSLDEIARDRLGVARRFASDWRVTVLLKGAFTLVAAPDGRATIVPFANPLLASAGSGDVLAGAVVGLLAQGLSAYDAAVCAAYLHALAGALRQKQIGDAGLLASDLLPLLPVAMHQVRAAGTIR